MLPQSAFSLLGSFPSWPLIHIFIWSGICGPKKGAWSSLAAKDTTPGEYAVKSGPCVSTSRSRNHTYGPNSVCSCCQRTSLCPLFNLPNPRNQQVLGAVPLTWPLCTSLAAWERGGGGKLSANCVNSTVCWVGFKAKMRSSPAQT